MENFPEGLERNDGTLVIDTKKVMTFPQYALLRGLSPGRVSQLRTAGKLLTLFVPELNLDLVVLERDEQELNRPSSQPKKDQLHDYSYKQLGVYFAGMIQDYEQSLFQSDQQLRKTVEPLHLELDQLRGQCADLSEREAVLIEALGAITLERDNALSEVSQISILYHTAGLRIEEQDQALHTLSRELEVQALSVITKDDELKRTHLQLGEREALILSLEASNHQLKSVIEEQKATLDSAMNKNNSLAEEKGILQDQLKNADEQIRASFSQFSLVKAELISSEQRNKDQESRLVDQVKYNEVTQASLTALQKELTQAYTLGNSQGGMREELVELKNQFSLFLKTQKK